MKTVLHSTQILGPIDTFATYLASDQICIDQHEHYQKRSYRNKYKILTTNGPITLSIPLAKGKNSQQSIKDVQISYDERWNENHLHTIRSAYGRSPYFEFYYDDIVGIFNKRHTYLFDLNMEAMTWALKKLKLNVPLTYTDQYYKNKDSEENVLDIRQKLHNDHMQIIKYGQVWEEKFDFVPNLSILDLLFCKGPESSYILNKMNSEQIK